jgi:tetratricopeptide (TPR) repeat protein
MDAKGHARRKARTTLAGPLPVHPILAGAVLACIASQALGQQPAKSRPGNPTSTPTSSSSSTVPSNDIQKLLAAAQAAQEQGRFDEAIYTYNRVIVLSANQPRTAALASLRIGNLYMVQRKFENAASAFQRATTFNPTDAEAYNNMGEALGELKQYTRAIEAFNIAARLDQKLLKARYNQGVSYDRMGNFRYAEFVFRNLIKSNPDYALAYGGLAVTLSKAGRARESIAFHEKAIALDPHDPSYYFNLALSYLILGDTAKALEQQEKLKTIDPAIADRLASLIVKHQM